MCFNNTLENAEELLEFKEMAVDDYPVEGPIYPPTEQAGANNLPPDQATGGRRSCRNAGSPYPAAGTVQGK